MRGELHRREKRSWTNQAFLFEDISEVVKCHPVDNSAFTHSLSASQRVSDGLMTFISGRFKDMLDLFQTFSSFSRVVKVLP